jgi:chemotaxis protein histidine kinase CheA
MSAQIEFNANMFVSEQLNRQLINAAQDLAQRCVNECAKLYGFDAEEAVRLLGLAMIKLERTKQAKVKVAVEKKATEPKPAFPMPYNGEFNDNYCYALRQNNGLYTQCTGARKGEAKFCKSCANTLQKTGAEIPEYGTIQQRMEVGIFEYVDPKGRKPVAYTKIMKKNKITQEQALEEAGKFNITINPLHFEAPAAEAAKRGRPSAQKEKEPKEKGAKGRPKKSKKVLQIEGDDNDLFATLVAEANMDISDTVSESSQTSNTKPKKNVKSEEEKAAEKAAKEAEKAEKEAKRLKEKEEKEAKLAAEKAEKEAKKAAEKAEKEAKKAAEEAAKKEAAEKAKAEKEAKKAEKEAKKPASKKTLKVEEPKEEEQDVVKKIEFEGKKYLKSKKTGIVYDYNKYVNDEEQVIIGKWSEEEKKIIFDAAEESEDEYD